jgi:homoserine acetyltransferase
MELFFQTALLYHTYGKLNSDKSNVMVCHALTANSDAEAGWGYRRKGFLTFEIFYRLR